MERRNFLKILAVSTVLPSVGYSVIKKKSKQIPSGIYTTTGLIPYLKKYGIGYKTYENQFGTLVVIPHPLLTEACRFTKEFENSIMFGRNK